MLTPREMIELYVGEENVDADHIDFKKALDLLDFVNLEDEEKLNIWLHIWCRSIMKNTWTDIDKDNPLESVRDTVFFRLVEFAFMQGRSSPRGQTSLLEAEIKFKNKFRESYSCLLPASTLY